MTKWEYRIESAVRVVTKWTLDKINELGREEWEAVGVFYDAKASQTYILFKRPLP